MGQDLQRAKGLFDFIAPVYRLFDRLAVPNYQKVLAILDKQGSISRDTKVLDVGTGTGILAGLFLTITPHVTGIDISCRMLGIARKRLGSDVDLRCMGAHELSRFGDGEFDLVTSSLVLHGFSPDYRCLVLKEMRRVARSMVAIVDYVPHHNLLVACIEKLEDSYYREFMMRIEPQLRIIFPSCKVTRLSGTIGLYCCKN